LEVALAVRSSGVEERRHAICLIDVHAGPIGAAEMSTTSTPSPREYR